MTAPALSLYVNGFSHSLLRSAFLSLACVAALSVVGWYAGLAAILIVKAHTTTKRVQRAQRALAMAREIGPKMVAGLALFILGFFYRDHQLAANQFTYQNVVILDKLAERKFIVHPDRMKIMNVDLCPQSSVDWQKGDELLEWTFEQRRGCKRVISYHKGELNASN